MSQRVRVHAKSIGRESPRERRVGVHAWFSKRTLAPLPDSPEVGPVIHWVETRREHVLLSQCLSRNG